MNLDKFMNGFIDNYLKKNPYANKEEVNICINQMKKIILDNKDKTPLEIIDLMMRDYVLEIDEIRKKYGIPGFTIGMKVGKIKIKIYGGKLNYIGEEMKDNALFDIASMSKFYTQVICYNLLNEGYFNYTDKISNLDNRFKNLDELTIEDILTFGTTFETELRISNAKNKEEALNLLFNAKVVNKNKYNYNDIGMMIIKEVMEKVSGMTYEELVNKYIIKKYNLSNTYVIVPKNKFHLVTGTPNFKIAHINDPSANVLGGFSGHAGIFSSSDDLIKFMMMAHSNVPNISDAYTKGKLNDAIGIMGNAFVPHQKGLVKSFVDTLEPIDTFAIQGSTRVNANAASTQAHNILFNPSSMSMDEAKERVNKINEKRIEEGKKTINPLREYELIENNKSISYKLIDARELVPLAEMEKIIKENAMTLLKLNFFNEIIRAYEKNYGDINYILDNNSNKKI